MEMSNSGQDRANKGIQPARAGPGSWNSKLRAVTDDAKTKLSKVEIILKK